MLSSATPWLLFAYFMLFRAWYVLSPPSSLGMEIGTWMALRFWYIGPCCGTQWFSVVRVFLEYMDIDALKYAGAPDPLWGSRVYTPHGCMGLMAGYAACCAPYIRHFPLVPVQSQSTELPATTVGGSSRGGSLRRHKAGPLTVLLTL